MMPQFVEVYFDGVVQDCSTSSALAMGGKAVLH